MSGYGTSSSFLSMSSTEAFLGFEAALSFGYYFADCRGVSESMLLVS